MVDRDEMRPAARTAEFVRQLVEVRQSQELVPFVTIDPVPVERQQVLADPEDLVLRIRLLQVLAPRTGDRLQEVRPYTDTRGREAHRVIQVLGDATRAPFLVDRNLDRGLPMLVATPPGRVIEL